MNRRWLWTGLVVIYWRAEIVRFRCVTALLNATLLIIQHAPMPDDAKLAAARALDRLLYGGGR